MVIYLPRLGWKITFDERKLEMKRIFVENYLLLKSTYDMMEITFDRKQTSFERSF